jgi:hypothetical protein
MRYLITTTIASPYFTKWFDTENTFNAEIQMVVYDLLDEKYTTDGEKWHEIEVDNL